MRYKRSGPVAQWFRAPEEDRAVSVCGCPPHRWYTDRDRTSRAGRAGFRTPPEPELFHLNPPTDSRLMAAFSYETRRRNEITNHSPLMVLVMAESGRGSSRQQVLPAMTCLCVRNGHYTVRRALQRTTHESRPNNATVKLLPGGACTTQRYSWLFARTHIPPRSPSHSDPASHL